MIPIFLEAALRSLLVGTSVAIGLRIFRVRNVLAQKAAWGLVLASAFIMPLLLPMTAQWRLLPESLKIVLPAHPMTLLEELQARIRAEIDSASTPNPVATPAAQSGPSGIQESPLPEQTTAPHTDKTPAQTIRAHRVHKPEKDVPLVPSVSVPSPVYPTAHNASPLQQTQMSAARRHIPLSPVILFLTFYCGIATLFVLRLALGLFTTMRLWRSATPAPVDRQTCDAGPLQIRASSRISSPITIGSGILLPADYTTWDSEKLRIVLAHEYSHIRQGDFYLQLLTGIYAALVWFSPLGWWLKHELAELAEAISDRAGMKEATSRTSYAQILLEFAATSRRVSIGVAMARPGSLSRRIERLLNENSFRQCFAGGRRSVVAVALVPLALIASTTLVSVQAAAARQSSLTPTATATSAAKSGALAEPTLKAQQPEPAAESIQHGNEALSPLPVVNPIVVTVPVATPVPVLNSTFEMTAVATPAPVIHIGPVIALAARSGQEGGPLSFDRTLSVSGTAQLTVSTGAGNIHITRGSGSQVHIHGKVHVNHDGSEEQARHIAANPPIEQNGDTIRVGQHQEQWRGISIDYEVEAPANTLLTANSGSGNIVDEGVGQNAKLQTGSGDIKATGLEGAFMVKTGSGNITAVQTGKGDVIAETGSGDIELKDIHGSFHGQTGSGDIKASGTPSASWVLQTGSGDIELSTGNAPLTLEASTGSGSVKSDHEMMVQGSFDHHHIHGTLNGGGPTVQVHTGSGDIRLH